MLFSVQVFSKVVSFTRYKMMKIQVLVIVVLVGYISGTIVKPEEVVDIVQVLDPSEELAPTSIESRNVIAGVIATGDKLLHRAYYSKLAAVNVVQTQDIRYVAASTVTRITYISALAVGATQSASAEITTGGVNTNNVTIRLSSVRGVGFDFWVEIWGR